MNYVVGLILTLFFVGTQLAVAEVTLDKLKNDKEVVISSFDEKVQKEIIKKFSDKATHDLVLSVFNKTLKQFIEREENQCDLRIAEMMKKAFEAAKLPSDEKSLNSYFKLARIENNIDDILYEILGSDNRDLHDLQKVDIDDKVGKADKRWVAFYKNNDVKELYSNFEPFPDDKELCAYQEYVYLLQNIVGSDGKRPKDLKKALGILNKKALEEKAISLESFHKLEFLRKKSEVNDRHIFLREYLTVVSNAKNQMIPNKRTYKPFTLKDEDKFSSERMKRFSRLTRRKLLYRKYNETQIILLAQVLQKASRRMGVDVDTKTGVPYITQEFEVTDKDGSHRNYVETIQLDPQSQFNYARRMLRKDITETQMMDIFTGLKITYSDVVMAAFETGYISIEDISYAVRYDDLWNPETSKFERVMGFVFKVSGYGTFFLPPPWNVVGTIALGIVEGIVDGKTRTGAENDNPATFIE